MKKLITLLLVFTFFITACSSKITRIEGQYQSHSTVGLDGIILQFTLEDINHNNYPYKIRLKKDGNFSFKIKQRGEFLLHVVLIDYPDKYWEKPILSNENEIYYFDFEDGKINKLEDIYISDVIKVNSPEKDKVYNYTDELILEWEKVPFADFYDLGITKIKENNEKELMISTNYVKDNKIELRQIKDLDFIEGVIDFDTLLDMNSFNRKYKELTVGEYELVIVANKILEKEGRIIRISRTSKSDNYTFFIR